MMKVAVSQRVDVHPARPEARDAVDQRLLQWLLEADFLPCPVPNILSDLTLSEWLEHVQPQCVVLSGGNDVGRNEARDRTETALLQYASDRRLPLLGICRGMQMMGHWQQVPLKPVQGHVRTRHTLTGQITGEANSYHDYALSACPPGYRVLARSEDGEIEAMGHDILPWEGWMWHPEREIEFLERDIRRVQGLFNA